MKTKECIEVEIEKKKSSIFKLENEIYDLEKEKFMTFEYANIGVSVIVFLVLFLLFLVCFRSTMQDDVFTGDLDIVCIDGCCQ